MKEGDVIQMEVQDEKTGEHWIKKAVKYRVLKVYPYFVLCQHCQAGYRECFQRRAAG